MSIFRPINRRKCPVVLQAEMAECGLACVAMIAGFHGREVSLPWLRNAFSVSSRGMTLRSIIGLANTIGLDSRPVKLDLDGLQELQLPAIIHWDMTHFVVLEAVDRNAVVIVDPGEGRRRLSHSAFAASLTGIAVELWPGEDFHKSAADTAAQRQGGALLTRQLTSFPGIGRSIWQFAFLGLLVQLLGLTAPFYLQWLVDDALPNNDFDLIWMLGAIFMCLVGVQILLSTIRSWLLAVIATQVRMRWNTNVMSHLLKLPVDYFSKRSLGDTTSRLGSIEHIHQTLSISLLEAVLDGVVAIAVVVLMLNYSVVLTAVATATVVCYALLRQVTNPLLAARNRDQMVAAARQQSILMETIRGIQAIRIFQIAAARKYTWLNSFSRQLNMELKLTKFNIGFSAANAAFSGFERILVIALGTRIVADGAMSLGMLVAFLGYREQFAQRAMRLVDVMGQFVLLRVHFERLSDITATAAEDPGPDTTEKVSQTPHLSLRDVSFRYADNEPDVVKGVNLEIPFGSNLCITGPSGCGKSTLAKLLLTILRTRSGGIFIDGLSIDDFGIERYRSLFSAVMQDDIVFAGTIADNIHLSDLAPDSTLVQDVCESVGLHTDIAAMPMGYRTLLGEGGSGLSGGQKQRILLARALYRKPKILILDEATSHLDVRLEASVNSAIKKFNVTRIVIAHRPETINAADVVVTMEAGAIAGA